jgi:type IX secretion system PorP/SprF family membrane protein
MIKKIFNSVIFIFIAVNYYAQEPVFSQFYFNPLYLNPAMSGMDNNFRLFLNNKNQWSKVPGQFNTTSISFDSWQNFSNSSLSMLYSSGLEGESYFKTDKFHFGGAYRLFDVFPSPIAWQPLIALPDIFVVNELTSFNGGALIKNNVLNSSR